MTFLDVKHALPVWPAGLSERKNCGVGFRASITVESRPESARLRIAAHSIYRLLINGRFVAHGPVRASHGHARVDEWNVEDALGPGTNEIAIEVVSYRVNTYHVIDEPPFLLCELDIGGQTTLFTHPSAGGFTAFPLNHRVEKVHRYSFQRGFTEVYHPAAPPSPLALETVPARTLLPRRSLPPDFRHATARLVGGGTLSRRSEVTLWRTWFINYINPRLRGFPEPELEAEPIINWQQYDFIPGPGKPSTSLRPLSFLEYDFSRNHSGFIRLELDCRKPAHLLAGWDEIKQGESLNIFRCDCVNLISWHLEPGTHALESFEPYTLRHLRLALLEGEVEVKSAGIRSYAAPPPAIMAPPLSDAALRGIYEAAVETYRQNAAELFIDCPGRERASWLADSFFLGRTAFALSGSCATETAFLENYLTAPEPFPHLPAGMLPMCYPADHDDGSFIPQWTLWLILQLKEFRDRRGDISLVARFEPKIRLLLAWFAGFENELGLLEDLAGRQFVEWSKANDLTKGVNFPTNWLYAAALEAAADLYGEEAWRARTGRIRACAADIAWTGEFFADSATRESGRLVAKKEFTETCQYYAFYFHGVSSQDFPVLHATLFDQFGPTRDSGHVYSGVAPSRLLYGQMMRLELLLRDRRIDQLHEEIKAIFAGMAERTGTLWELDDEKASCCHGFASHAACLFLEAARRAPSR